MAGKKLTGVIRGGRVQFIYDDLLQPYIDKLAGEQSTRRASHVEPSDRCSSCWMVDFAPLDGSKHYEDDQGQLLRTRGAALVYEAELLSKWMHSKIMLDPAV
jgi:hypothetical protein